MVLLSPSKGGYPAVASVIVADLGDHKGRSYVMADECLRCLHKWRKLCGMLHRHRRERLDLLREILGRRRGGVSIAELAGELGVSRRSVQYDLRELRRQGVLIAAAAGNVVSGSPLLGSMGLATFVGRSDELSTLADELLAVWSGAPRILGLVGEPGIGKTRIAEEVSASASGAGFSVAWGRCTEGEPPFWPWTNALAGVMEQQDVAAVGRGLGAAADRIATSVPELHRLGAADGVTPSEVTEDPQIARFRLLDALKDLVLNLAGTRPLLIVLDDLQWADESSIALLEHVATYLTVGSLVILGTVRSVDAADGGPARSLLANLARLDTFRRFDLDGFGGD